MVYDTRAQQLNNFDSKNAFLCKMGDLEPFQVSVSIATIYLLVPK